MRAPSQAPATTDLDLAYYVERLRWLIGLRWLVVAGVVVVIAVAEAIGILADTTALVAIVALMAAYNFAFLRWQARRALASSTTLVTRVIALQLMLDVAILTALLHFSDGVENPFVMFFAFPIAVGAKLLPLRLALLLALGSALLHSAVVIAEYNGLFPHHAFLPGSHDDAFLRSPFLLIGHLVAFVVTMFGIVYFVHSIAQRFRDAAAREREHDRSAHAHERMARVGGISAGVAHAIRNPLHGLMNSLELLSTHLPPDPVARETLVLMGEGLTRIDMVTQRLLVLARDAPLVRRPTDINDLVRKALWFSAARSRIGAERVATNFAPVGEADVDPDRLSEALVNVIDNALAACAASGTVTVKTYPGGDAAVCIEVSDSGQGIAAIDLPRIFDPFFSTKAAGEGTGLGLAITKRIMEEHGGEIQMDSRPAEGTLARLIVPRSPPLGITGVEA